MANIQKPVDKTIMAETLLPEQIAIIKQETPLKLLRWRDGHKDQAGFVHRYCYVPHSEMTHLCNAAGVLWSAMVEEQGLIEREGTASEVWVRGYVQIMGIGTRPAAGSQKRLHASQTVGDMLKGAISDMKGKALAEFGICQDVYRPISRSTKARLMSAATGKAEAYGELMTFMGKRSADDLVEAEGRYALERLGWKPMLDKTRSRLFALASEVYGERAEEKTREIVASLGLESRGDLSEDQAQMLIVGIEQKKAEALQISGNENSTAMENSP